MENATKALLIAGSVLIAILLIAFGLRIFNSTKGTSEAAQTAMDATAISTFNNQFIEYAQEGKKLTYAQLLTAKNKVNASNAVNKSHNVYLQIAAVENASKRYKIAKVEYTNGYITNILVTEDI